jgi:hypothetical protein
MKFFSKSSDGGKNSGVTGFFLVEIKPLFSIVLLHFNDGTREAFHSHAFNALTWFVKCQVEEHRIDPKNVENVVITRFSPGVKPKFTPRNNYHKVNSIGESWAISFRGPWKNTWQEYLPKLQKFVKLTNGRKIIE